MDAVRAELRAAGSFNAELVAARAGCSTATFYSHFATKDDALAGAFDLVLEDLVHHTRELFSQHRLAEDGLEDSIDQLVDRQAAFFRRESLVFRAALARLPERRDLRNSYRRAEAANLAHLVGVIEAGQQQRLIRAALPELLAETVLVLAQGINNPRLLQPKATALRAEVASAILSVLRPEPVR